MRAFIAAEIPPAIQETFALIQKKLHYSGAIIKWVKPSDIHLTLRFLGEVKEDKIGELCKIGRASCRERVYDDV